MIGFRVWSIFIHTKSFETMKIIIMVLYKMFLLNGNTLISQNHRLWSFCDTLSISSWSLGNLRESTSKETRLQRNTEQAVDIFRKRYYKQISKFPHHHISLLKKNVQMSLKSVFILKETRNHRNQQLGIIVFLTCQNHYSKNIKIN